MNGAGSLFVTFEGVEGAGKTTQIALLRAALEASGLTVCVTREPGGDTISEAIRALLLEHEMTPRAELLLFLASRAQNVEEVIRPRLAAGDIVLCDRFIDSSIAYQGVGRGLGRDRVAQLNAFAVHGVTPDLTVLLDLPPETGLARQLEKHRMELENLEFHERVRQGFAAEARNDSGRFCVLDAQEPPDRLHAAIFERVQAALAAAKSLQDMSAPGDSNS